MSIELHVAVDVGNSQHRVAIGLGAGGAALEEFDLPHTPSGISHFFARVKEQARVHAAQVCVAMEGHEGYARPLDTQILAQGWRLYAINNLKFARFKEIFPAPAKTDAIDARRMLQLMQLREQVPLAQAVLQEVAPVDGLHQQLKALTRRRQQLVRDHVRINQRMQGELQGTAPGLLAITGQAQNLWFLNFLLCKRDLRQLKTMRPRTLLGIRGIGPVHAASIAQWQPSATFAPAVAWTGPMIQADARRMLALRQDIALLGQQIAQLTARSPLAQHLLSLPGLGAIGASEVAGEIGNIARFAGESSLAMYVGVAPLDDSSGKRQGTKLPRQINPRARDALLIATVHHMGRVAESRAYYDRKRAHGKTHQQALRALARQLVRVIYSMLTQDRDYRPAIAAKKDA